jgi:hypothetical protein
MLGALHQLTVVGGDAVPAPQAISTDAARRLGGEFRMSPPRVAPTAANALLASAEVERAARNFSMPRGGAGLDVSASPRLDIAKDDKDNKETKGGTRMAAPVFNGPAPTLGWTTTSVVQKDVLTGGSGGGRGKDKDR